MVPCEFLYSHFVITYTVMLHLHLWTIQLSFHIDITESYWAYIDYRHYLYGVILPTLATLPNYWYYITSSTNDTDTKYYCIADIAGFTYKHYRPYLHYWDYLHYLDYWHYVHYWHYIRYLYYLHYWHYVHYWNYVHYWHFIHCWHYNIT